MILSWLVPLLAASSVTAFATRSSLTRGAPRHDVISSRQAHIQRDLLDVCAGLDVDLNVANIVVGHLDVCLCISLLPDFVAVDAVAQAAVALVGEAEVLATLEALVRRPRYAHYRRALIFVCYRFGVRRSTASPGSNRAPIPRTRRRSARSIGRAVSTARTATPPSRPPALGIRRRARAPRR